MSGTAARPDRRSLLKGVLGGLVLTKRSRRAARPNLLVIGSDQQHWQAVGFEDPFFHTPALDELASRSFVFERAFCTSPQCSPSRSSMLSGHHPHRTGVRNNQGQPGDEGMRVPTIAKFLKELGYRTAYHGKWHLGNRPVALEGWDVFRPTSRPADKAVARMTRRFLAQVKSDDCPFALFAMFLEPHGIQSFQPSGKPVQGVELDPSWRGEDFHDKPAVQREFLERAGVRRMDGAGEDAWREYHAAYRDRVRELDEQIGAVLAALEANGLRENTVVVMTSDHGDMDTRHRLIFKGPFMYEPVVRVPVVIHVPAELGGVPRRSSHFAWSHVDLVPTLLDLAGSDPVATAGRSCEPLLRGESLAPRRFVVAEFHGKGKWIHPIRMLRTDRYKYTRDLRGDRELYDLEKDPYELTNLAGAPEGAATVERLEADLSAWLSASGDPFDSLDPRTGKLPR